MIKVFNFFKHTHKKNGIKNSSKAGVVLPCYILISAETKMTSNLFTQTCTKAN